MNDGTFRALLFVIGGGFALLAAVICAPSLLAGVEPAAVAASVFASPFSSAFALDAIACWMVLAAWVVYEARATGLRHGWLALVIGVVPGVATGFALYLLLRLRRADRRDGAHA